MRLLATLLATLVLGSGCVSSDTSGLNSSTGGAADETTSNPDDPAATPGTTSDPGQPTSTQAPSKVKVDPNATFEGQAHKHDWWGDDMEVVIMDRDIPVPPVCVGEPTVFGCSGAAESSRFIRLSSDPDERVRPNIVFEGTGRMEIKVNVGSVILPFALNTFAPGIPFNSKILVVDQASKTFVIDGLNQTHTDGAHVRISSWYWRLESTTTASTPKGALWTGPFHLKVTVFRDPTYELPLDPPHPDHWNGTKTKLLYEATTVHRSTATAAGQTIEYPLYAYYTTGPCTGTACNHMVAPPVNHTVPIGAGKITIKLRWTNSAPTATTTRLMVDYCAGDQPCGYTSTIYTRAAVATDGTSERTFEINVRPDQWDTPYMGVNAKGSLSKWRFRWSAESTTPGVPATVQGSVSWLIEVHKAG